MPRNFLRSRAIYYIISFTIINRTLINIKLQDRWIKYREVTTKCEHQKERNIFLWENWIFQGKDLEILLSKNSFLSFYGNIKKILAFLELK